MNKFKFYFILLISAVAIFSCSKNDSVEITPPRDYKVQYTADSTTVVNYLKSNYITVIDAPGEQTDQDVTISKIVTGETSIWDQTVYPLKSRNVKLHGITYKIYYLELRKGVGQSPTNTDAVLASYNGHYLQSSSADNTSVIANAFEEVKYPNIFLSLLGTIKGWGEIFPQFKTGTYQSNPDGTVTYTDFGAGVMFIPSGLAYYSSGASTIPAYSPLVFSFKLYEINRLDSDEDGVLNFQEDKDMDGYMYDYRNTTMYPVFPEDNVRYADDTERDGIPNYLDRDDDGDGYITNFEISKGTDYLNANSHP